jgi:alpha-L-fucosidase
MLSLKTPYLRPWAIALGLSFGVLAAVPSLANAQAATSSTAPTATQDPKEIDQAWQRGNAKYDEPRAALLKEVDRAAHEGPFRPDWESLEKYEVPEWYKDAKFGIFIHWGVYSVPAFGNEWYPRNMYRPESDEYKHHIATYGPVDKFGYKDFVPMFKAEHFDAAAWAQICRPGSGTPRRFRDVRQRLERLDRRENGAAPRCDWGIGQSRQGGRPSFRCLVTPRRA